jgi:hypothetical protein
MNETRNFSALQDHVPPLRNVDNDAPSPMRQEILAATYGLLPMCDQALTAEQIYYGIEQMLGEQAAGNPMAGLRQRLGRDLANAHWARVYDVISWLWAQFQRVGLNEPFRQSMNQILAAYGAAWDLAENGQLVRVLPAAAQNQIVAAIVEIREARYAPALALFNAARDAYDGRPRRDRDTCGNIFDALESVAKIKYNRPNETFGQVKNHMEQNNLARPEIIEIFTALNQMRNHHFGHGGTVEFNLSAAEVDFVYLTCIASILLLTRRP